MSVLFFAILCVFSVDYRMSKSISRQLLCLVKIRGKIETANVTTNRFPAYSTRKILDKSKVCADAVSSRKYSTVVCIILSREKRRATNIDCRQSPPFVSQNRAARIFSFPVLPIECENALYFTLFIRRCFSVSLSPLKHISHRPM